MEEGFRVHQSTRPDMRREQTPSSVITMKPRSPKRKQSMAVQLALAAMVAACSLAQTSQPSSTSKGLIAAKTVSPPHTASAMPTVVPVQNQAKLTVIKPETMGIDPHKLEAIDRTVHQAMERHEIPGAVVGLSIQDKVVFRKAYGYRSLFPKKPMLPTTIFDLASLTKPLATGLLALKMMEKGIWTLEEPVSKSWPAFACHGKDSVTIKDLLLHVSGLPVVNRWQDFLQPRATWEAKLACTKLNHAPQTTFSYSDLGYIVLGIAIEKRLGKSLDQAAQELIFKPAELPSLQFFPNNKNRLSQQETPGLTFATTEKVEQQWLSGRVHDPRARAMGGVAGHAGLFGQVDDLLLLFQSLLITTNGRTGVFQSQTVRSMFQEQSAAGHARSWLFDRSSWQTNSKVSPEKSWVHTGFTGTAVWIDPIQNITLVVLTNRLHPDGKGNANPVREKIKSIVTQALRSREPVRAGIDVLKEQQYSMLAHKKIALVTHLAAQTLSGTSSLDELRKVPTLKVSALFVPEHGLDAKQNGALASGSKVEHIPVFPLYGKQLRPTKEQLKGIDTLVFDLQAVGTRFFTYVTTLGYLLEASATYSIPMVILDRPNPQGGRHVWGPLLAKDETSFTGYHPMPVVYGMTIGELGKFLNAERKIHADLTVVPLRNWLRGESWASTQRVWPTPSPNLPNERAAFLYPGLALLEFTNVSVGRGTALPFEQMGAPFINAKEVRSALQKAPEAYGVSIETVDFTPVSGTYAKQQCHGVRLAVSDPRWDPVAFGLRLAYVLQELYPTAWKSGNLSTLLANRKLVAAIKQKVPLATLKSAWQPESDAFAKKRMKYLLYP
jgi:uncharacterized protein YbbC (DUF1343 family)/CubicO group peptidase (beta-lactamase class C family)